MNNQSVLTPIRDQILFANNFESAQQLVLEALHNAPVRDQDIKKMEVEVKYHIRDLTRLKFFVHNMLMAKQHLKV